VFAAGARLDETGGCSVGAVPLWGIKISTLV